MTNSTTRIHNLKANGLKWLYIYKDTIVQCPKPECGCYLITKLMERAGRDGKYLVFQCELCRYQFSENQHFIKTKGHVRKLRNEIRNYRKHLVYVQTTIKNLEAMLFLAENDAAFYNATVKKQDSTTRRLLEMRT